MAKKWIKRIGIIISIPFILISILIILLYIPPVQNFAQRQVTTLASEATGMDISIGRIGLRFPLNFVAQNVQVVQATDTLLLLEELGVEVRLTPLFKGNIEARGMFLKKAELNTAHIIPGMQLSGSLEHFYLDTRNINLAEEAVNLDLTEITNANLTLVMNDTIEAAPDTTATPTNWRITLAALKVKDLTFALQLPADTTSMALTIAHATMADVLADLGKQLYSVGSLRMDAGRMTYNQGLATPLPGLDPAHIALNNIKIHIDSVRYAPQDMAAVITDMAMTERSGLRISTLSGRLHMDSAMLNLPALTLKTPYSEIALEAQTYFKVQAPLGIDHFKAKLNARLGRQDVLLLGADLPEDFRRNYPTLPLTLALSADGSPEALRITRLVAELPGALTLKGSAQAFNLMDSVQRSANIELEAQSNDLHFLLPLAGLPQDSSLLIPPIGLRTVMKMQGPRLDVNLLANESEGSLTLDAMYNLHTEAYTAQLRIDSLQMAHFMPNDSVRYLTTKAEVRGRGVDFTSARTTAAATAELNLLEYAGFHITDISLTANLQNALATARLTSNNDLLVMDAQALYKTNSSRVNAQARINIENINLHRLGLIDRSMEQPLAMLLSAHAREDSVMLSVQSGDINAGFRAQGSVEELTAQSMNFANELLKQIEGYELNHANLRQALPTANLTLKMGKENFVSRYLAKDKIGFEGINATFRATPRRGLNGHAMVRGLKADTLQLDTLFLVAFQDTARLNLRAGVINGPKNPQITFRATLTGEVRSEDAELMLEFKDHEGQTGLKLGANVRPHNSGVHLQFIPENPVVAFRNFAFNEHNQVFIRNNGRVLADVEMLDKDNMGFRLHSLPDTTYLQNLDIEIRRIELGDISRIMPYYPSYSGLFSAEAIFQQTEESMQLSTEMRIQELLYENKRAGNIGIGATWLPGNDNTHYVDAYLTLEDQPIMNASGSYQSTATNKIDVDVALEHFPLYFANLFVQEELIELSGDLDGQINIAGTPEQPLVEGELLLDNVTAFSHQYGLTFNFEKRPLNITKSRLVFDKYNIYTAGKNPFVIDGNVDFANPSKARADLTLNARNYELLNSPRRNGRLLYGKVYVDINSTLRGPLTELMMRGNLNVLGTTDVKYVLADSPLTVQDRLGDMVQFVSFADTLQTVQEEQTLTLGGLDLLMTINIDQSVEAGVDLTPDRSSFVDLEGGGNLTFQYTPQGDMILSGRYTLTGGNLKYSLPVIPLKEFAINEGSYVEWMGNPMDPRINFKAGERMRISVPNQDSDGSRMVSFDVSIEIKNSLNDLELVFDLSAPEDSEIQRELDTMAAEERSKQAVAMMATGIYLHRGSAGGGDFDMGSAINNLIQNQLAGLAGSALKTVNITFGMENYDDTGGSKRTDYNFKYAQRFFNDRVQVVIGGTISTGDNADQSESFIDNVSLEYRLDTSGTRYVRLYHDRNYEGVFEGEIVETGVGLVLRKKVNKLGELFIFRKNK